MRKAYIERRAAQEELKALPATLDAETVQRCIEAIANLPSEGAVVRDCFNMILAENDTMRAQLAALGRRVGDTRPLPNNVWRSVEEEMPEDHEEVLIAIRATYRSGKPYYIESVGCYGYGKWHARHFHISGDERVTHWMPLPSVVGLNEA